jgi:propionyl-CoA carboxylase alpha chain
MFSKILIANRGEIACRVIKTARRMGIKTVVVYSDADKDSLAVEMADEKIHIGGSAASESYLRADKIIAACKQTGAEAVHPGFGFLSEKADFARQLAAEGIVFIGPNPHAIDAMGDKIESKKFANAAKVNTVPGYLGVIEDAAHAVKISDEIGYPVMLKASAGGGGKGMRIAWSQSEVAEGFNAAQAEAKNAFGDDRVFIEKFVTEPRHIEIQVLGDKHGNVIHLNERECSIQRRNQKVIEEAPSPFIDADTRASMGAQAVALAQAVQYDSAGTVEFIVDGQRNFYFLEMNTRLQVEHPVTEMITGVDLVEQMIRVAYGEKLSLMQKDIGIDGWAVEVRVYAEDPYRKFLPSIGRLVRCQPPEETASIRNDTGIREGDEVSMFYDPMISKLVGHGPTRLEAIDRLNAALDQFLLQGVGNNIPFVAAVLDEERFRSGKITTAYIADMFPDGFKGTPVTSEQADMMTACICYTQTLLDARARTQPGQILAAKPRKDWTVLINKAPTAVQIQAGGDFTVRAGGKTLTLTDIDWMPGRALFTAKLNGAPFTLSLKPEPEGFTIRHRGSSARVMMVTPREAELYAKIPEKQAMDGARFVLSPMPGLVVSIDAVAGQEVKEGQILAIIEAMKMQNIIRAERDGVVKVVGAKAGDAVAADEVLVEFA